MQILEDKENLTLMFKFDDSNQLNIFVHGLKMQHFEITEIVNMR